MSTPNLVPRGDLTGSIGTSSKRWATGSFGRIEGDGSALTGIISSATPTGVDRAVQFKSDTITSGSSNFTFDSGSNRLEITGSVYADSITGSFSGTFATPSSSYIDLDQTINGDVPSHREGRIYYDSDQGTLVVFNDEAEIALNVGQEFYVRVYNNSGATITNGTPVFISGSQGDYPYVWEAVAITHSIDEYDGNRILGVATHDIEDRTSGYITENGLVRSVDLSAFNPGDVLYVSSSSGELTKTRPPFPYEVIQVGFVVRAASNGIIYVKPEEPVHLNEIATISGSAEPTNGDLWVYDSIISAWKNTRTLPDVNATGYFNGTFSGTFVGNGGVAYNRTEVSQSTYIPLTSDYILGVTHTTGSSVTIQLNLAENVSNQHYVIKDEGFSASINNITIQPSGSDLIDNTNSYVISTNGGSINIYNDSVNWFVY